MLANLITTGERTLQVTVTEPIPEYENYSFRNVESGYLDTTFTEEITTTLTYQAGEGYLYQVAPVVLYGGRLIYNEPAGEGQTLMDDMIIENGATLTIYGEYNANANIIVKNGSIVNGENGKIHFAADKKLIIEGTCSITGNVNSKLTIEFTESQNENIDGIMIKDGKERTIMFLKEWYK